MRGIDKEMEIPKLVESIANKILDKDSVDPINKHMRTAREIMNDYGLGGEFNG